MTPTPSSMETHAGLKMFLCQFCTSTFASEEDLKGHIRKIHIQGDPDGGNHIKQIILQAGWQTLIKIKERGRRRNNYFCGECDGCLKKSDCGECPFCRDKAKFGGPNKLRKKCARRVCGNKSPMIKKANKAIMRLYRFVFLFLLISV